MPTAQQIRNAIDARLALMWVAIQSRENTYYANNGHYWQGVRTHTTYPTDGGEVLPDVGNNTPTDQPTAWPAALLANPIPMALEIDVYDGPLGKGYQATVYVTISGKTWSRSAQVGPEIYRTRGWHELVRRL